MVVSALHQRRLRGHLCQSGQMIYTDNSQIQICGVKVFTNHPLFCPAENGHFHEVSGCAVVVLKTVVL